MAKTRLPAKTIVTHPVTGTEMKFDSAIYDPVKVAILQSLKGSKGKSFTDLTDHVVKIIKKKLPGFMGSIPWYTISVKLDLETRGIVETVIEKGKKLNRLKKEAPKKEFRTNSTVGTELFYLFYLLKLIYIPEDLCCKYINGSLC